MKRFTVFLFVCALIGAAFGGGIWYARRASAVAANAGPAERTILYWVDPMHPAYKSDKPGIAPDCGMKLVAVYADEQPVEKHADEQSAQHPDHNAHAVAGEFQISPERQQLIGVVFSNAEMASGTETVRAVGRVVADETRITRIHPKIEGWIERTQVDFTGQLVAQGAPLLSIYSPELLASQQELLLAIRARESMRGSGNQEAIANAESLVAAARRRLELWDLSASQVEEVEKTRTPLRAVTLYSPAGGYVTARNAFPGQKVTPETELYAIADLNHVWIMADVFEADLGKIGLGQAALVTPASGPGGGFVARVSYIQPQIDPATRTLKVRLESDNPRLRLKPDMFVNVEFRIGLSGRVTVPADAVVNTGTSQTVFVDLGDGRLEPRSVELGERIGDRVQILRGLHTGERVVSSGTFLVDSEAKLKGGTTPAAGGHRHD
jgi:membrane fusion protein, copper/silver efflux system